MCDNTNFIADTSGVQVIIKWELFINRQGQTDNSHTQRPDAYMTTGMLYSLSHKVLSDVVRWEGL